MGFAGCATPAKDIPFQDGVDYISLEKDQEFKAPVRGQFLSDNFYKFQFERCKQ